jgi:glutathione S-transferase
MIQITQSYGSPFVRKVRLTVAMKGIADQVEFIDPQAQAERNAALRAANPLQKIPAARLADGTLIFDSHVICEHLDGLAASPRLFPAAAGERAKALTLAALADGIMDATVLVIYEGRFRPEEKRHQEWVDRQQAKVDAGLAWLEANIPVWNVHPDYGHITLACALGFLDDRQAGKWRAQFPKLAAWLARFDKAVPVFAATAPPKA